MPHDPMAFYSSRTRVAKEWTWRKRLLWFVLGIASLSTFLLIVQRWPL